VNGGIYCAVFALGSAPPIATAHKHRRKQTEVAGKARKFMPPNLPDPFKSEGYCIANWSKKPRPLRSIKGCTRQQSGGSNCRNLVDRGEHES